MNKLRISGSGAAMPILINEININRFGDILDVPGQPKDKRLL